MARAARTTARRSRAQPKSAAAEEPPAPPIERQAIVVVHGQGLPRPMGTLRDFVKTLWTFDPGLEPADPVHRGPKGLMSWVVPDEKAGLHDLQRIACPGIRDERWREPGPGEPSPEGRRTDFFELYYSDLLSTAPARNLVRWLRRMLWINPTDVQPKLRFAWAVFWLLTVLAVVLALSAVLSFGRFLATDWLAEFGTARGFWAVAAAALALAVFLLPKFFASAAPLGRIPRGLPFLVVLAAVAVVFGGHLVFWLLLGLAVELYLAMRYLLPYFGDSASYLSAQTETVEHRQAVRSRGVKLLRDLHADPRYDRIVIVAHSLGTVLAYDLLHILWGQVGPVRENPPAPAAAAAIDRVDAFAGAHGTELWSREELAAYRGLQWQAFNALRARQSEEEGGADIRVAPVWKVSDFVTLGSPLTNAHFLIADNREEFAQMVTQRVLPTSPPQPYDADEASLYRAPSEGGRIAHHAAVFSVVRWTNIYDPYHPVFFLSGDPIAGPVGGTERFGRAVRDVEVEIRHGGLRPRFFTHNWYWTDTGRDGAPAPQVTALREAVGLACDAATGVAGG